MNYNGVQTAVLKLLDEYSRKGNPAAPSKTVDYRIKIPEATNSILMNLAGTTGKLPAEWEIINFPVLNESTRDTSKLQNHIPGTDDIIATLPGARSYFLEVSGHYHVVIEEKIDDWWDVLADLQPIPGNEPTTFTEVKGLLTPSSTTNAVRIRLTGNYVYPYRHQILYPYSFPSAAEVQQNRAWFEQPLPADWLKFNNAMIRRDIRQWVPFAEYKLTPTHFAYNRYATGEIIVNYWRKPKAIVVVDPRNPTADELAQVIDAMPDATEIVPLGVAGTILVGDDNNASSYLLQLYNNGKFELTQNEGNYGLQPVTNINGW